MSQKFLRSPRNIPNLVMWNIFHLQSSPTGPAEHCAGGSRPKSCNSWEITMKLNKNSNSSKQLDGPDTAQPKLFKTLLTTNVDRPYNFHARPKGYTVAMGVNIYFQLSIRQKTPIQKHQHLLCLSFLTPFSINPIILLKSRGKYIFY